MFKSLFGIGKNKTPEVRTIESAQDLQVGDIIKFKPRTILPPQIQGQQFEITAVGTYQYPGQVSKELQLRSEDDQIFFLAVEEDDGEIELALSMKLSRNRVLELFDEDQFAELWQEHYPVLKVQKTLPELEGWISDNYRQNTKEGEAYYYDKECQPSRYEDDEGEELRYHECSAEDNRYGLSVEIWEDGSTDVALTVYTPLNMIDEFWPKA